MQSHFYMSSTVPPGGGRRSYRIGFCRPAMEAIFGKPELEKDDACLAIFQRPNGTVMVLGDSNILTLSSRVEGVKETHDGWKLVTSGTLGVLKHSRTQARGYDEDIPRGKNASTGVNSTLAFNYPYFYAKDFDLVRFTDKQMGQGFKYLNHADYGKALVFAMPESLELRKADAHTNGKPMPTTLTPRKSPEPRELGPAEPNPPVPEVVEPSAPPVETEPAAVRVETALAPASMLLVAPEGDEWREELSTAQYNMIKAVLKNVP